MPSKTYKYPLVLPMLQAVDPDACAEFHFCDQRKWRADYAIPSKLLLIEIEGGGWSGGRHTTGSGFAADREKYNAAACLGYRILKYSPQECNGKGLAMMKLQVEVCINHAPYVAPPKKTTKKKAKK